jgi:hypothetical protein
MENLSQNERIRRHLEAGKTITPLEALSLFGCFRLGARIHNLKETGLAIHRHIIEQNGKHFAQYSLAKMLIVGLILFSSCTTLRPGCHHQHHAVRIAQLDQQYEQSASFSSAQMQYRNWQKRPMKMIRIPFTQLYIP